MGQGRGITQATVHRGSIEVFVSLIPPGTEALATLAASKAGREKQDDSAGRELSTLKMYNLVT